MAVARGQTTRMPSRAIGRIVVEEKGLRRDVGRIGLLFAGVGSIIGSGWLFGALTASTIAGPAAIVSWLLGGVMVMLIGVCYAELGAMLPVSGGVVRYPHYSFGSLTSYTGGWITWVAAVTTAPIEVLATLTYATNYVPWLTDERGGVPVLTPAGYAVAVVLMFVFCLINAVGVRAFARFNTALVWWKLAIITLVIVAFFLAAVHPGNFSDVGGFAPSGASSIFSAVASAGIVFSYLGFRQGIELAGESANPSRNVPLAVIGSIVVTIILYTLLQVAFIGALPAHALDGGWSGLSFANDFGPLAGLASLLGLGWLAVALYADAIVSPADTGLIYTATTSRIAYAMGRNRNAPGALDACEQPRHPVGRGRVDVRGRPGRVPAVPELAEARRVHHVRHRALLQLGPARGRRPAPPAPGPGAAVPRAGRRCDPAAGVHRLEPDRVLGRLEHELQALHRDHRRLRAAGRLPPLQPDAAPLEWRAGCWIGPWLAGLMVISYLGDYGDGRGVLTLGWGALAVAALSCAVYALAMGVRLAPDRVVRSITTSPHDEPPKA